MITPQDIKEKTFEKALFGGYDMAAVDSFLEDMQTIRSNDIAICFQLYDMSLELNSFYN